MIFTSLGHFVCCLLFIVCLFVCYINFIVFMYLHITSHGVLFVGEEDISTICEMFGAHVELNRDAPHGPDKEFVIRGNPDQIQHAMHLINEKLAVPPHSSDGRGGEHGGGPG